MGDLHRHHVVVGAKFECFCDVLSVQRFGLSGFLSHTFFIFSSEEKGTTVRTLAWQVFYLFLDRLGLVV